MPHGKLTVIVDSADGIKDPSKHGRGDSYCTLQCGNQVLSTHVAEGAGSHPTFQTEFKFEIDRSTNELFISVYSAGSAIGDDELVGSTTLDFKTVFFHGHSVPLTAYPLSRLSGRAGGHVSLSLQFKARPPPHAAHNPHHGPVRRNSAPLPARPHDHNIRRHDYETSYEDGYGSSGSSESSRRSGEHPYRRSQSEPEQYYEEYGSPAQADAGFEFQPCSFENYEYPQRPSQQQPAPHAAQPRHPHQARPLAHQATPKTPNGAHRAIPVNRPTAAGPVQSVQRVQYQPQQGQPQQRMQAQPHQGTQHRPSQGVQGVQPQQGRPRQGMQGRPQQRMQGQPRQGTQGQPRQGTQNRPQQGTQNRPAQETQKRPQQGIMAQAAGQVAQAVAGQVVNQGVQALAAGFGDILGGLFGGD